VSYLESLKEEKKKGVPSDIASFCGGDYCQERQGGGRFLAPYRYWKKEKREIKINLQQLSTKINEVNPCEKTPWRESERHSLFHFKTELSGLGGRVGSRNGHY